MTCLFCNSDETDLSCGGVCDMCCGSHDCTEKMDTCKTEQIDAMKKRIASLEKELGMVQAACDGEYIK